MNKIITTESDVELDPESLMDPEDNVEPFSTFKSLEAIRELEQLINNSDMLESGLTTGEKQEKRIPCLIKIESKLSKRFYVINAFLNSLNQTVVERDITEIELNGEDKKLIGLFSFYQNNIFKEKKNKKSKALNSVKVLLKKNIVTRRRKRKTLISKNDVLVSNFYVKLKNKKVYLFDLEERWKVNEMKYTFDNNRSTIRILLVRSK
jgi:hypothetical protein